MILEVGALALPFTLLAIDGREYTLPGDLGGRPAVLAFFKTTCATCDVVFPYLNRLRDAYPDGWLLWAIAQEPPDRARDYAARFRITYPVLIDAPQYTVSKLYDPPATPTLFLIGPNGRIEYTTHGFAKFDVNDLAARLAGHLGVKAQIVAPAGDGRPDFKPG